MLITAPTGFRLRKRLSGKDSHPVFKNCAVISIDTLRKTHNIDECGLPQTGNLTVMYVSAN